jgi:hypothetical protein
MASDPVKEATELLRIAMKDDKLGKKGDAAKQLAAATAYLQVQRLFVEALKGESTPGSPRQLSHECCPHLTRTRILTALGRFTDPNLNKSVQKAIHKKQEDVKDRLKKLQEKLTPDQHDELRLHQHTYTLTRSAAGLGMTISPSCDIDEVKPGSAADTAGIPAGYRIVSVNGMDVTDRDSIVRMVQLAPMGGPLSFYVQRSGGYSHNPMLGEAGSTPPMHLPVPCSFCCACFVPLFLRSLLRSLLRFATLTTNHTCTPGC